MTKYIILFIVILASISQVNAPHMLGVEVKTLDGISTELREQITGDLIVLDFWVTGSQPCINSILNIAKISKNFDESQVQFLGINEDSLCNLNELKPMIKSLGIPYCVLLDVDQALMSELKVSTYPTLVVLNKSGEILYTHVGYSSGDESALEHRLNELAKK